MGVCLTDNQSFEALPLDAQVLFLLSEKVNMYQTFSGLTRACKVSKYQMQATINKLLLNKLIYKSHLVKLRKGEFINDLTAAGGQKQYQCYRLTELGKSLTPSIN